jgi:serine protease Do
MNLDDRWKQLIIFIVIGILAGVGTFRLAQTGRLPLPEQTTQNLTQGTQTRSVVKEENAVIDVAQNTSPSVVAIGITERINPFDPYNPYFFQQSPGGTTQNYTIGTGFIADAGKGLVITNKHVVADSAQRYSVITKDGKKLEISKIYRDPNLDLAIVQVSTTNGLKTLQLGDSGQLKVGQTVIAIGNALGRFDNTVTTGVVSGLGRTVNAGDPFSGQFESLDDLIQTDAAINPGNSGGPLLNSAGQVIGVNVATTEGAQNIGFAIPINSVKTLLDKFNQSGGDIQTPYLGIRYRYVTRDIAILNEIPQGAYIQEVVVNSPAEKAGITEGVIITKIDGQSVDSDKKISEIIQGKKVGDRLNVEFWEEGNTRSVQATLEALPNQ